MKKRPAIPKDELRPECDLSKLKPAPANRRPKVSLADLINALPKPLRSSFTICRRVPIPPATSAQSMNCVSRMPECRNRLKRCSGRFNASSARKTHERHLQRPIPEQYLFTDDHQATLRLHSNVFPSPEPIASQAGADPATEAQALLILS